jgi:hypothetical protein
MRKLLMPQRRRTDSRLRAHGNRHNALASFICRRAAFGLEKARAGHQDGGASGAGRRDVQTIEAVQELH